jgi:GT2 family glycosyltransferase
MPYSVVIPSKRYSNLAPCVTSIRAAGEKCPVIVVDNGLEQRVEGCEYVDYEGPFVYAKAVNLGIQAAGADDVIILGDDGLLKTPMGFAELARIAAENPDHGIISPVTNSVGNRRQMRCNPPSELRDEPRILCFVCVYVKRSTIEKVGYLDERYCLDYGCEDGDLSYRVILHELKLGITDNVFIDHLSLKSTYRENGNLSFQKNKALFEEKFGVPYA